MIQLKFPVIQKLIDKDLSSYEDDDPRRSVMVLAGHAVVMNKRSVVCFDLESYFQIKEKKQTADQIADLDAILDFMNGKVFSKAFWEELTKGAIVSIKDTKMHLEGAVKKDLIHEYSSFDYDELIKTIEDNVNAEETNLKRTAFYVDPVTSLLSSFKTLLKGDSMIFEFVGVNTAMRFTFQDNPWIFGLLHSDMIFYNKRFVFEDLDSFFLEIKK